MPPDNDRSRDERIERMCKERQERIVRQGNIALRAAASLKDPSAIQINKATSQPKIRISKFTLSQTQFSPVFWTFFLHPSSAKAQASG